MTSNTLGLSLFPSKRTAEKLQKVVSALMLLAMVVAGSVLPYGNNKAEAALSQVSAIAGVVATNPATGFPLWYQDAGGVALQQCLGINADGTGPVDPKCVLPGFATVPNVNVDLLTFPDESFYYFAEAPLLINGAAGRFRILLEAAFLPTVALGNQTVFTRASLFTSQAGVFPPNSSFHVEYPFGAFDFSTDAFGGMIASSPVAPFQPNGGNAKEMRAEDALGNAPAFSTVLATPNTNFGILTSVTAPAGYLGDGVTETPVTGGTNGNVVTITQTAGVGPFTVVGGTNWIVAGKIAVIDTLPPAIGAITPAATTPGATNVILRADVTDTLEANGAGGVTAVTADLGALSNTMVATLTGAQETPPSTSLATGAGSFTIDTVANTLTINSLTVSGAAAGDPITDSSIHGTVTPPGGAAGNVAPEIFLISAPLPATGTVWNYPEAMEAEILAGRTYVHIHSFLFPNGMIRGQIVPTPNVVNAVLTAGTKNAGTWSVIIPSITRPVGSVINIPITATDGTHPVTVNHSLAVNELTSVTVTPATAQIIGAGTQQLTASPLDNNGAAFVGATITWSSSNPAVATVDANGLVTGVLSQTTGTATITATAVSGAITVTGSSAITVLPGLPVFSAVVVTPAINTIILNSPTLTKQLSASANDQFGTPLAVQPVIAWTSSDPLVATVDANGLVTAVAAGTATITASATADLVTLNGTATVNVVTEPQVLTSVTLTPAPTTVVRGATTQLIATGVDQFGGPMITPITLVSDNPAVATVDANGLVAGVTLGTANITATSGALSATSAVTVTAAPQVLTSATVTPNPATVLINSTKQLTALGKDQFGDPMVPQPAFTWTSGSPLVTVDANGMVTAGAATGTVVVTATNGLVSGTTTVNVVTDFTAPVITITGANPTVLTVGQAFADLGATAIDETDGAVVATTTSNNVNANEVGTYAVTYTATDAAGNVATATRTVQVNGIIVNGGGSAGGGGGGGGFGFGFSNFLANIPGLITTSAGNQTQVTITNPQGQVLGEATVKFNRNRGRGERGDDIRELQIRLQQEGVFDGPFTGFFGPLTQEAIRKLQIKLNLTPSGILDIDTRIKLNGDNSGQGQSGQGSSNKFRFNTSLRLGSRGVDVMELQKMLQEKGFFTNSSLTQFFGPITQKALIEFQRANGISPTGFFGPITRAKVNVEVEQ